MKPGQPHQPPHVSEAVLCPCWGGHHVSPNLNTLKLLLLHNTTIDRYWYPLLKRISGSIYSVLDET